MSCWGRRFWRLLENSEVAAAEVAFNEALRLGVNRAEVAAPLAASLVAQARQKELIEHARFAPSGLPPGVQVQLLLLRSGAHADLGNPSDALRAIAEARTLDPGSPDSWLAEVPIRIRARQITEATVAAEKALALAPSSAQAHYLRGTIAHAQGQQQAALAAYERALKLQPEHVEALVSRAGLYLDLGRPADAGRDEPHWRRQG